MRARSFRILLFSESSSIGDGNRCFEERTANRNALPSQAFPFGHRGNQASVTSSLNRWKTPCSTNLRQKLLAKPARYHTPSDGTNYKIMQEMKTPLLATIVAIITLAVLHAADSKCVPLKPGEARVSESPNDHGGMTLTRAWRIDADTACAERIVMNADKTVRGRVVTTYRGGKHLMALAYKGMADPWFIEHWTWPKEGGYSVERRSFDGQVLVRQIFPADDRGLVQTLDADGKEISDERYKKLSDEVCDLLF